MDDDFTQEDIPVAIEIDGTIDLHTFSPKDLKTLIPEYLQECRLRNIFEIKIIHGKGTGSLRRTVHALLARDPIVQRYYQAGIDSGGWGATIVILNKGPIS